MGIEANNFLPSQIIASQFYALLKLTFLHERQRKSNFVERKNADSSSIDTDIVHSNRLRTMEYFKLLNRSFILSNEQETKKKKIGRKQGGHEVRSVKFAQNI